MGFQLVGLNHKTAPVAVRERLAIPEPQLPEALQQLLRCPGIGEGLILCTCNRVELLVATQNGSAELRTFFRNYGGLSARELDPHLYEYCERDAVRHLFRVAASLDSMVLGETQILRQIRQACAVARKGQTIGCQLNQLLNHAFAVAKRVRTETLIGSQSVSIASVAVELAERIFGSVRGAHVFLVGAGAMGELAARHLMTRGAASLSIVNRTYERAVELAAKFGGAAVPFEELYATCHRADIIIASTGAPTAIFRREHGEMFLGRRRNRPMFFLDIAVPRDVDPQLSKVDGIFVYNVDDLQEIAAAHAAARCKQAVRAESIIDHEVERFHARLQTRDVVPAIILLQEHFEGIRRNELLRLSGLLASLTAEQQSAVDALTRGIVNKIVHTPIMVLKTSAQASEGGAAVAAVTRLFGLSAVKRALGDAGPVEEADQLAA